MIVDLVRNDLSRVCGTGSIAVEGLLSVESQPGLVHLVSTVTGQLAPGRGWTDLIDATFPPGSVTGAPKSTAVQAIADLEPVPRGPYAGAVGWVDADSGDGELAVGIRTFWAADGRLHRRRRRHHLVIGPTAGMERDHTQGGAAQPVGFHVGEGKPMKTGRRRAGRRRRRSR